MLAERLRSEWHGEAGRHLLLLLELFATLLFLYDQVGKAFN
jgi:hypothetical protein